MSPLYGVVSINCSMDAVISTNGDQFGVPTAETDDDHQGCQKCKHDFAMLVELLQQERSEAADRQKQLLTRVDQLARKVVELTDCVDSLTANNSSFQSPIQGAIGPKKRKRSGKAAQQPTSQVSPLHLGQAHAPPAVPYQGSMDDSTTPTENGMKPETPTKSVADPREDEREVQDSNLTDQLKKLLSNESDDEDGDWQFVCSKKPSPPKAVLFVGNLPKNMTEERLRKFVLTRSEKAGVSTEVFSCKIFSKQDLEFSSARLVFTKSSYNVVAHKVFWHRPVYVRDWDFNKYPSSKDGRDGLRRRATNDDTMESDHSQAGEE